jgi:putative transcriptional regulator
MPKRKRRKLNLIKEALKATGKSQTWLAAKLDVDPGTVNRWCTNTNQPDLEKLYEIAYLLKISARELIIE